MKHKPTKLGLARICPRHKDYVKECPRCNREINLERHASGVIVPVYRVRIKQKENKYAQ
jgi:hypothetical protein